MCRVRDFGYPPFTEHPCAFVIYTQHLSIKNVILVADVIENINVNHPMMTSSNGKKFRVTGYLCGEFTGPRWIPRTKASGAELRCFLSSASE